MSTKQIPDQGRIRIVGRSETMGELGETYNLDINNPIGKIKASKSLVKVLDETDLDGSRVNALAIYRKADSILATRYYALSNGYVSTCVTSADPRIASNWEDINDAFVNIFDASGIGGESDAVVFNDLLLMSRAQDILSWNNEIEDVDWWTTVSLGGETGPALTAGYPHTMHVHKGGAETLFVTNQNKVHYANTVSGHSTITLGTNMVATCLASGVDAIWAGTYSESSDYAYVYEMFIGQVDDLGNPIANRAFKIDARAVLSIEVINNVPYIITEKGNLQVFNGAGFVTVESLPFAGSSYVLDNMRAGDIDNDNNQRAVHPKGMRGYNDSIFINYKTKGDSLGGEQDPYAKRSPSGIYEYNTTTGQIHHRFAFSETVSNLGSKSHQFTGPLMIVDSPYALLMAGAEIDDNTGGLFMEAEGGHGYFVTQEYTSNTVEENYEAAYIKAKTLAAGEEITLKYRTTKRDNIYFEGTLSGTNVINTTTSVTGIEVGDELFGIYGTLSGKVAHVTAINVGTVVTTITLDTDIGTIGQTGGFESTNFKLSKTTYTTADGEYKKFGGFGTNPWIQFKVWFVGNIEMRQFISKGNSKNEK